MIRYQGDIVGKIFPHIEHFKKFKKILHNIIAQGELIVLPQGIFFMISLSLYLTKSLNLQSLKMHKVYLYGIGYIIHEASTDYYQVLSPCDHITLYTHSKLSLTWWPQLMH